MFIKAMSVPAVLGFGFILLVSSNSTLGGNNTSYIGPSIVFAGELPKQAKTGTLSVSDGSGLQIETLTEKDTKWSFSDGFRATLGLPLKRSVIVIGIFDNLDNAKRQREILTALIAEVHDQKRAGTIPTVKIININSIAFFLTLGSYSTYRDALQLQQVASTWPIEAYRTQAAISPIGVVTDKAKLYVWGSEGTIMKNMNVHGWKSK